MSKRRVSLRLADDEVAVVGPIQQWQHMIMWYEVMAEEHPADADAWYDAANWIREWVEKANPKGADDEW